MLVMRFEIFTPGRDGVPPDEGFEAVSRQKNFVRPERDDRDFAVPDEPPHEVTPEVVFLPGLGGGQKFGHSSPRYSRMRFRVENMSLLVLPFTIAEAHPFVRPIARPIFANVILFWAQWRIYAWMISASFFLSIMYIR